MFLGLSLVICFFGIVVIYRIMAPRTEFDKWAEEIEKDAYDRGELDL